MAAWFMRRLRCADRIQPADGIAITVGYGFAREWRANNSPSPAPKIATGAGRQRTVTCTIIETTCCTRERAGMR